jgi:hypothetical protein
MTLHQGLLIGVVLALTLGTHAAGAGERTRTHPKAEATEPAVDDQGLGALIHASPERVRARLGDPDVARAEGKGGLWTYRLQHCALFLFFHMGPQGLRVSGASTGVRKRGEPLLDVKTCIASAVQLGPAPDAAIAP